MSEIVYHADGLAMTGYLARPDGEGPWPAMLIGHDGVGLAGPDGKSGPALATVPGVGYHPAHAVRAWQAVIDHFDDAFQTSSSLPETRSLTP